MQEVFNKKDLEIMDTFYNERCINKRTQYGYNNSFSLYIQYTKMHLQDLLMEADIEEEKGVRWKRCKLKEKLIGFRGWLQERYKYSTIKVLFNRIKTFYNHFEIEIGFIPYYYTFCSPEATKAICAYLLGSGRRFDKGCNHHLLFKTNIDYLNNWFNELNEKVNAGQVADMNRIRSHMLRKFHASRLYNDGLSIDKIDALQGRAKDNTHKAYFKESPEALKELYIEHMDAVRVEL